MEIGPKVAYIEANKIHLSHLKCTIGGKIEGTFSISAAMAAYIYLIVFAIRIPAQHLSSSTKMDSN